MADRHHRHPSEPYHAGADLSSRREARLRVVLILNLVIVAGQAVFGVIAHSLGLLADAGHNLADVAAVGLSWMAVRWTRRAPTDRRSFGYHRGTILAAQANAASVLAVTVLIVYEAIRRLLHPQTVDGGVVVVVAAVGLAINAACAWLLREPGHDLNMRSALLHMTGDAAASLGVALAGAVILLTGRFARLDPAVSLMIAGLIAAQAWQLLRATNDVLLESTPHGVDPNQVADLVLSVEGVDDLHDLHIWSLSSDVRALSAHVLLSGHPTLEEAQQVGNRIKAVVAAPFGITHATLELECEGCVEEGSGCTIESVAPDQPAPHSHRHGRHRIGRRER